MVALTKETGAKSPAIIVTARANDSEYEVFREKSYCYILEYVYEGSGIVICDGKEYKVKKGDVYLLPKGSCHRYYPEKSWDKIWFNIDGTLVSNLIYSYDLNNRVVFKQVNNKKIFEELYEITNTNAPAKEIMLAAAIKFHSIVQLLYGYRQKERLDTKVNAIKRMLDAQLYQKDISLKDIAKELCISQAQIINIFKKTFNMTPYQYFLKRRIEIAAALLLNSNMQVKEIAELLHYSDQPYFSNAFKKIIGVSPEKYRKMNLTNIQTKANLHNKFSVEEVENLPFNIKVERH